ncbi:Undecaprenyl-phosphate N-acetylglucosaminyl 1-phosphate transferase [hydrothermal vent metagenome]|uniref:Undecaprenyl-phosphate N-acetylglucosaminyl 1-phosphate transferase n=1 Tax=hydrothermal vent metagenome TaxID=652676 RepID=A0A1W1EEI2_9ZZZZ
MTTIFLYAFLISLTTNIAIIYFSHRFNLFIDDAGEDKPQNFHSYSTPRAGGIGIIFGMFLLLLFPFALKLIIPIVLAFASGIFEDFNNSLSPKFRLFLQLIAAFSSVALLNAVVTYLGLGITMPYWLGIIFSAFAIVGMMNAVNIIDGFNGLASGVVLLILTSFATIAYHQNNIELLNIIFITAGSLFAFFLLNFPKGKIFLGDGGAYMLGFIVAIIGIFLASKYESVSPWYILAIFIYPVWEVVFSIIRKKYMGLSPMQPDSYHLHMLVYRQVTQNNPMTALFITISLVPFMVLSTIFANKSITNISIAFCFILFYSLFYFYLYKKDTKEN